MSRTSELTYTPAWWVPGAHVQTLWGKFARRVPDVATRSERWRMPDGGEVELRRLVVHPRVGLTTPRLLVLHGLEGSPRSHYLRGVLAQARDRGWQADALIFRGCSGENEPITLTNRHSPLGVRRMYHSGETTDLDAVVNRLVREHPDQTLVLAGFSLGGNVLLKWLGERSNDIPPQVCAAAAVSVPYDLERGARHIERGFSRIYTWHFLRTLRMKATAEFRRLPPGLFNASALERARTLYDFDDVVTAPLHGFANAHDYYARSSSLQFLPKIRRPTLLLSALDDPFTPQEVFDDVSLVAGKNDKISVEFWRSGGHVGFVSGRWPLRPRYFAEERVIEFLAEQVEVPSSDTVPS